MITLSWTLRQMKNMVHLNCNNRWFYGISRNSDYSCRVLPDFEVSVCRPKKVVNMVLTTNTFDEDTGPVECRIVASRVVTFQATF